MKTGLAPAGRLLRRSVAAIGAGLNSYPGLVLCLVACLVADFHLACALAPNADSVQSYNEMLSIRGGNVLLHNWVLATDNFLLTDLPIFLPASLLLGPGPRLIYLVPFLIFVLLLVGCLLLVAQAGVSRRERLIGCYLVLLLLGVPYGLHYNVFFWTDFHVATVATCLYAIVAVAPALSGRRFSRVRLISFTALAFAASFSDPLADALLLGPLILLVVIRAWLCGRLRVDDGLLIGCVALALLADRMVSGELARSGGFGTLPSVTPDFVPDIAALCRNGSAVLAGVQALFIAKTGLIGALPLHALITPGRLAIAVCTVIACLVVLLRMPRAPQDGVAQLLVVGAICLLGLEAMSRTFSLSISEGPFYPGAAIRFVLPPFVFLCIAASIRFGAVLVRLDHGRKPTKILGVALGLLQAAGAIASVATVAGDPPAIQTIPQRRLADWLVRNGLVYGVGDYWDTQLLHALSGGIVAADPVTQVDGRLHFFPWLADSTEAQSKRRPQFAIITPGSLFNVTGAAVTATYGKPTSIVLVTGQSYVARLGFERVR